MRATLLTLVALIRLSASAGTLVLEGNYQGKNLFIQNPFSEAGVGFCVYEVTVKIKHKDGCTPLVLNPEVLKPKSTFDIVKQQVAADGTYSWVTSNETGELPFIVEQKRWNKWVKVGEVPGAGTPGEHTYSFKVTPHSGENTFRVKQVDLTKKARYSQSVAYTDPSVAVITWQPQKPKDEIIFSGNTLYEVYDQYGNVVKRGYANKLDVSTLKKDMYYINYDNKMGETFIKR